MGRPRKLNLDIPKEMIRSKESDEDELDYREVKPERDEDDDDDDDDDADASDKTGNDDYDDTDKIDAGWLDDMDKMDPQFGDDMNMLATSVTPIDLLTEYQTKWSYITEAESEEETTVPTSTTLMDLSLFGFNETWCEYVNGTDAPTSESEQFIEAVKKLCSEEYAEDNDLRIALRHTFVVSIYV